VSDVSKEEITPSESGSNQVADEEEDSSLSGSGNDDPPSLVAAKPSSTAFCAGSLQDFLSLFYKSTNQNFSCSE